MRVIEKEMLSQVTTRWRKVVFTGNASNNGLLGWCSRPMIYCFATRIQSFPRLFSKNHLLINTIKI